MTNSQFPLQKISVIFLYVIFSLFKIFVRALALQFARCLVEHVLFARVQPIVGRLYTVCLTVYNLPMIAIICGEHRWNR